MKKLLTLLLTIVMAISLVNLSINKIKGDESNPATDNYLCFTAEEAGSTVWFVNNGTNNPDVKVSIDGGNSFNTWTTGETNKKTLLNVGDKIYVKGNNNKFSSSWGNDTNFAMTGKIAVSGNVMSLLDDGAGTATEIPGYDCFKKLFYECTSITSISENLLPAQTLASNCYEKMFQGCTGLTELPEKLLPAETLTQECYKDMFNGCSGLTVLPENLLPAKTMTTRCYQHMFQNCSGLVNIPNLPATTLAVSCYAYMFNNCSNIVIKTTNTGLKQFYINAEFDTIGDTEQMFSSNGDLDSITSPQAKTTYYLHSKDLYNSTANTISKQEYTGSEIKPKITLTHGDPTHYTNQPIEGTDYTVEYTDNINPGTATIKIKAKGTEYTGTKILHFEITSASPSPSKKDESCEKVIGPTWHWNNTKGICEDYGVVGTSTR